VIPIFAFALFALMVFFVGAEIYHERDWPRRTWKGLLVALGLLFMCASAFSQEVRVDYSLQTYGPNVPSQSGPLPQALWTANATVAICAHIQPASGQSYSHCVANPITTYTDSSGASTCPSTTPLVQLPGGSCTSSTGPASNLGFWYAGGLFDYYVVTVYGTYGPFTGPPGGGGGGGCGTGLTSGYYPISTGSGGCANGTIDSEVTYPSDLTIAANPGDSIIVDPTAADTVSATTTIYGFNEDEAVTLNGNGATNIIGSPVGVCGYFAFASNHCPTGNLTTMTVYGSAYATEGSLGTDTGVDNQGGFWQNDPNELTPSGSPYAFNYSAYFEPCDATLGNVVINLDDLTEGSFGQSGLGYYIVKEDPSGNTCTVNPHSGQTIAGQTSVVLSTQYQGIEIVGMFPSDVGVNAYWGLKNPSGGGSLPANAFGALNNSGTGTLAWVPPFAVDITQAPYNAACDGLTDDSVAIQAALDNNANIYIPTSPSAPTQCNYSTTLHLCSSANVFAYNAIWGNNQYLNYTGTGTAVQSDNCVNGWDLYNFWLYDNTATVSINDNSQNGHIHFAYDTVPTAIGNSSLIGQGTFAYGFNANAAVQCIDCVLEYGAFDGESTISGVTILSGTEFNGEDVGTPALTVLDGSTVTLNAIQINGVTGQTALQLSTDSGQLSVTGSVALQAGLVPFSGTATAGSIGFGTSTLNFGTLQPGVLYRAAGTALPSCVSGLKGSSAVVSDATNLSGAYVSGGAYTAPVYCGYNGSSYSWQMTSNGVASINSSTGPFTFSFSSGAGSCSGTTCTFTGSGSGGGSVTNFVASSWPTWLTPSVATSTTTPTLSVSASAIPNSALANPSTTVNGQTATLGSTANVNTGAAIHTVAVNEGNGNPIAGVGPGTSGQPLLSGGSGGDPTYGTLSSGFGGTGVSNTATLTLGSSNQDWATLGTGIVKNTTTTGAISDATSSDVVNLWTGTCNSSTFLNGAGGCTVPSGGGTVTTSGSPASGQLTAFSGANVITTATQAQLGTLLAIAQHNVLLSGGTASAVTSVVPSSTSGLPFLSQGSSANPTFAALALSALDTQAANTLVGNGGSTSAAPTALSVPSCSGAGNALGWLSGTGPQCNSSITAAQTAASLTMNNSGSGASSGTTFNGATAQTISYNTVGAAAAPTNWTGETSNFNIVQGNGFRITSGTPTASFPSSTATGFQSALINASSGNATVASGTVTYVGPTTLYPLRAVSLVTDGTNFYGTPETIFSTGLSESDNTSTQIATVSSNAVYQLSYQPGPLTSISSTIGGYSKVSKASTVDNITGSAFLFSCISNPTITMYECGTSATCASPTTIGTVTVTAAGTAVSSSPSSSAITAGDYVAWAITAGTCTSLDISVNSQVHSN
jgi:hypothetical protein